MKTVLLLFFLSTLPHAQTEKIYTSEGQKFRVETLAKTKDVVWGFDFLSASQIVFTERKGSLGILDLKKKEFFLLEGSPQVWSRGQGGMLDVRVSPKNPSQIYFTFSEPHGSGATTALATAEIDGKSLKNMKKLFSAHKANSNSIHFGSRIEFGSDDHLYMTIGDRNARPQVQDLSFHIGKIIRLKLDGSVPKDNPFVNQAKALPEIWSLGHRSPQGLVRHPLTNELWMAEMGPRGGDEINVIKKGLNYGWPVITYGKEYYGARIGDTAKEGMEQPITYWVPSISPSGIAFYSGDKFPQWKGNLFIANLSGTHLRRLVLQGQKVLSQEELLKELYMRFRNVRQGPDGFLYFSTDDGLIARLVPVQ